MAFNVGVYTQSYNLTNYSIEFMKYLQSVVPPRSDVTINHANPPIYSNRFDYIWIAITVSMLENLYDGVLQSMFEFDLPHNQNELSSTAVLLLSMLRRANVGVFIVFETNQKVTDFDYKKCVDQLRNIKFPNAARLGFNINFLHILFFDPAMHAVQNQANTDVNKNLLAPLYNNHMTPEAIERGAPINFDFKNYYLRLLGGEVPGNQILRFIFGTAPMWNTTFMQFIGRHYYNPKAIAEMGRAKVISSLNPDTFELFDYNNYVIEYNGRTETLIDVLKYSKVCLVLQFLINDILQVYGIVRGPENQINVMSKDVFSLLQPKDAVILIKIIHIQYYIDMHYNKQWLQSSLYYTLGPLSKFMNADTRDMFERGLDEIYYTQLMHKPAPEPEPEPESESESEPEPPIKPKPKKPATRVKRTYRKRVKDEPIELKEMTLEEIKKTEDIWRELMGGPHTP